MDKPIPVNDTWIVGTLIEKAEMAIASFLAHISWFIDGWFFQTVVKSLEKFAVSSQTSIVTQILGIGTKASSGTGGAYILENIIAFTTIAGLLLIIVRAGLVIFNAYLLNLEGGETVPILEYIKRIFFAIVFLVVSPTLIINGFVLITVLASKSGSPSSGISNFDLLTNNSFVEQVIKRDTYCLDANPDYDLKFAIEENKKRGYIKFLGSFDDLGGLEGMPASIKSWNTLENGMEEEEIKDFINATNGAFCLGQGAVEDPSAQFGFANKNPNNIGFSPTTTYTPEGGKAVTVPIVQDEKAYSVLDSLSLDEQTYKQTGIRVGRVLKATQSSTEMFIGAGKKVTKAAFSGPVTILLTLGFSILSGFFFMRFVFGIAERTIDIFATIWTLFLYASGYVSNKNNQMIGQLVKKVLSIYMTHLFDMVFFSYWFSSIATNSFDVFTKILVTSAFMKIMKKGNTAIQQYMDKTSEGNTLKGAKSVATNMLSKGGRS